jgi:hypothetical protein
MKVLNKFYEFHYPQGEDMKMDKPSGGNQFQEGDMKKLEDLRDGKITEVQIGEFTVSRPSELDGGYLVANDEGKHQKIMIDGNSYQSNLKAELKVLDILQGRAMLESRSHRRSKK